MALLNPAFQDPGAAPGLAANWTLRTRCSVQSIAGFGPPPVRAAEDFERWFARRFGFGDGDLILGMFGPFADGIEDWEERPFLGDWADAVAETWALGAEDWTGFVPIDSWGSVTSQTAVFSRQAAEAFTDWIPAEVAHWTQPFTENFSDKWPPMRKQ